MDYNQSYSSIFVSSLQIRVSKKYYNNYQVNGRKLYFFDKKTALRLKLNEPPEDIKYQRVCVGKKKVIKKEMTQNVKYEPVGWDSNLICQGPKLNKVTKVTKK